MGTDWTSIGSIAFGLIAWTLPVVCILRGGKRRDGMPILCLLSVSACAASLCIQVFYFNILVGMEDWISLLDTSGAVAAISSILLLGTLALNTAALLCRHNRNRRDR